MVVLETKETSPAGNSPRYVISVTQTIIKAVDGNGYPYYYMRDCGKLKPSAQSSQTVEDRTLLGLDRIESYVTRHGYSPVVFGKFLWNGRLRPYLNADNTINPQWKRPDGASIAVKSIKGIKIHKIG